MNPTVFGQAAPNPPLPNGSVPHQSAIIALILITLSVQAVLALLGLNLGRRKGLAWPGFFLGLLLGPVGLLILVLLPPAPTGTKPASDPRRKCPYCAELIQPEAIICRFCNRDVMPLSGGTAYPPPHPPPRTTVGRALARGARDGP